MRQRRSVSPRSITWSGVDPSNCWFGRCNHWPITFLSMISASASSNRVLSLFLEVTLVHPILHVVSANVHRGQFTFGCSRITNFYRVSATALFSRCCFCESVCSIIVATRSCASNNAGSRGFQAQPVSLSTIDSQQSTVCLGSDRFVCSEFTRRGGRRAKSNKLS
jgi:hypothetical protein